MCKSFEIVENVSNFRWLLESLGDGDLTRDCYCGLSQTFEISRKIDVMLASTMISYMLIR